MRRSSWRHVPLICTAACLQETNLTVCVVAEWINSTYQTQVHDKTARRPITVVHDESVYYANCD